MSERPHIPISNPDLSGNESRYVSEAVASGWVSSQGQYVTRFEQMLAEYNGSEYALAVSNGTVALHLALAALGIQPGDEVIVPDLTFAASINAVLYTGATPVVVDVRKDSFNLDPELVEAAVTHRTKAIMPVHLYGNPCEMSDLATIATQKGLFLLEDSAEAFGSEFHGKKLGSLGDVGTFSFYGNKTITTGEGGALLVRERSIYEKAKILRDHGMNPQRRYWHDYVGFNYRITNVQAALGLAQMERVERIVKKKIWIGEEYQKNLQTVSCIRFQSVPDHAINTYWLMTALFDDENFDSEKLMQYLKKKGIDTRPVFNPLHSMPVYQPYCPFKYKNSEHIFLKGISLPSYISLTKEEILYITDTIKSFFNE